MWSWTLEQRAERYAWAICGGNWLDRTRSPLLRGDGLLTPSERTASGHRRYGPDAVARLYRLTRLRRLGLSLDQIRRFLDDPEWDLARALRDHVDTVDGQIAALTALRDGVGAALAQLARSNDQIPDLLEVLATMDTLDSPLRRRIAILVYRDLQAAYDYDRYLRPHPRRGHARPRRNTRPCSVVRRRRRDLA